MGLGDLTKKLYSKKDKLKKREPTRDVYDSGAVEQPKDEFEKHEDSILTQSGKTGPSEKEKRSTKRRLVIFGAAVVAILVAIVLLVFIYYKFIGSAFAAENILIEIDGPGEVRSAEEVKYTVRIKNENRVSLQNSKLRVRYPDEMIVQKQDFILQEDFNAIKIDTGEIGAKQTKEFQIGFELFGPRDKQVYLNASLTYRPSNFNSDFEKDLQKSILIKSSPISLVIVPTKEAASGDTVNIDVIAKNDSTKEYSNLELRMEYPDGFVFVDSDQLPLRDNRVWGIEKMAPKEQKRVKISGSIEGTADSLKKFKAIIGQTREDDKFLVYTEIEGVAKIIPGRVEIIQEIRNADKAYAGTKLVYKIKFRNTSDVPLRDLILTQHISSRVLDLESFELDDGFYDNSDEAITWKAAQVPKLKLLQPGESGEVDFDVSVLENFPMANENDKNFSITTHAELESTDINSPIWQNKKVSSSQRIVKVNSKLVLNVNFAYNDGEIPNSGPVPLKVNEKTTITGRLNVMNTSNDLKNVIVKTSLPPGITWENNYQPQDPGLVFNDRTNELEWLIGSLDAGVGFISPVKTIAFQIGITPAESQVNKPPIILGDINVNALDTYTGSSVEYQFNESLLSRIVDVPGRVEEE